MTEFYIAIPEAVTNVQPFVQALEEAQRECQEATRYVQALGERLKQDRQGLHEAVTALENDAPHIEEALAGQVTDATANLGRVKELVGHVSEEWEQVFEEEDEALKAAVDLLPDLTEGVKEMAEKAYDASHAVLEWVGTVSEKLEESVASVEAVVNEGLTHKLLAQWRDEVEKTVASLVAFMEKECHEQLNTKAHDWEQKIAQLHTMLDHTFEEVARHEQEVATYTAEQWAHLLEEQIDTTQKEAHALADTLGSLGQAVENYEGELQVATQMVTDHQQQTAEGAAHLEEGFGHARSRWSTFGVTC